MDIKTLYTISSISRISILLIFFVMLLSQPKSSYLLHWIMALVSSSIGSLLGMMHVGDSLLTISSALVIYPLFFLSLTASWSGLRIFYEKKVPYVLFCLLILIPGLIYCLGIYLNWPSRTNLSLVYMMAAFTASMVLFEIYYSPDKKILSQYVVAVAFLCYLLALLLPAVMIALEIIPARQNSSSIAAMLFDQSASILVYFGYIAMNSERANITLQKMAETDQLTDLTNRRGALKTLESFYLKSNIENPFSIIIGDVDFFKKINDTLGHQAGDVVLKNVASIMKINIRKSDRAVRWGGEEFLIILPETSSEEAIKFAERIRSKIENNLFTHGNEVFRVTMSFGVSTLIPSEISYENIIARADENLYRAKKGGRNRVCSYLHE